MSNKKLTMVVTIEFNDSIDNDYEKTEVAQNVCDAIEYYAKTHGIAPEESETFTKSINISNGNIFNINKVL
jgi:uncharacterized surface protein with fasciclin (FAS1) repeats